MSPEATGIRHMIRTKIIATLGPASSSTQMLTRLIHDGVDVFRLNFSHGKLDDHAEALQNVREVSRQIDHPVAVLGDLCGPKIRMSEMPEPQRIETGDTLIIQRLPITGTRSRISSNYPHLVDEVQPGERVLIDDGSVRLLVVSKTADEVTCQCTGGGTLSSRKGINLPDTALSLSGLTDYDRECVAWAIRQELDYLAMSFVRGEQDMTNLRLLLGETGQAIKLIAKVERREAVEKIEGIIGASDGVMVARGDMGVEMDLAMVPVIQKQIIRSCQAAAKPVIVATQMLQSMIDSPTPTRAEVSDVANAVYDCTDAVMLSGETAMGKFPDLAVSVMSHVAEVSEQDRARTAAERTMPVVAVFDEQDLALARAAWEMARTLKVKLVVIWSQTGAMARIFSKLRLDLPVVALSSDDQAVRQMALLYGIHPRKMDVPQSLTELAPKVQRLLLTLKLVDTGDSILIVGGTRLAKRGRSNAIMIHTMDRFMD